MAPSVRCASGSRGRARQSFSARSIAGNAAQHDRIHAASSRASLRPESTAKHRPLASNAANAVPLESPSSSDRMRCAPSAGRRPENTPSEESAAATRGSLASAPAPASAAPADGSSITQIRPAARALPSASSASCPNATGLAAQEARQNASAGQRHRARLRPAETLLRVALPPGSTAQAQSVMPRPFGSLVATFARTLSPCA
ncbi:MAG: hypothetical protein Fur0037_03700 [Planctomycetota bacterium]